MNFFGAPKKKKAPLCVLHIDDSKWVRIPVSIILRRQFGLRVLEAESGPEGVRLAEAERPDVIILDLMMPLVDGFDTLAQLKDNPRTKHIPVIMCTARDNMRDVALALRLGARDYMTKPIDERVLIDKMKEVLEGTGLWKAIQPMNDFSNISTVSKHYERVITEDEEKVAPSSPPTQASKPAPSTNSTRYCQSCGKALNFIPQYQAWYCYSCRTYPELDAA